MKLKSLAALIMLTAGMVQSACAGPLSINSKGQFVKDGKPFYGVGVNYFDGFYRYSVYNNPSALTTGLATLKQYNVPFIRVPAIVFWPNDIQKSYVSKHEEFLNRLKAFMDAAKAQNIGVVLDVFYNWSAFPDLKGEHLPAIGDSSSKTRDFMRTALTELVTKFKDHEALWAWEFANEATTVMDIPPSVGNYKYLPSAPTAGAPERTVADNIKPSDIISALKEFATVIRSIDPNTPIFSGNDVPYYCANNLQRGSWNSDNRKQFGEILDRDNPAPIDTLSMHLYPKAEGPQGKYFTVDGEVNTTTYSDILAAAVAQSVLSKRPFFLGEFGVDEKLYPTDAPQRFEGITNAIITNKVQMSALWVYDYSSQDTTYNVTATNARKYQLEKVRDMNTEMSAW